MSVPNTSYNNISAITQKLYMPKLVDNIFDSNVLLKRWRKNNVQILDGGTKIVVPLLYKKTTASGWYSGAETLNITSNDKNTAAEFDWRQAHASVTIAGIDQLQNEGKSRVIAHVQNEIEVAEMTLSDDIGTGLYNTGATAKAIIGLRMVCAATGTYGGIAKASNSWWQGNVNTATSVSIPTLTAGYGDATIDADQPTVTVTTQDIFDFYEALLEPKQRYMDANMANAGFSSLMFKNKPMVVDSHCPDDHLFMLNEKYISLKIHKSRNFKFEKFVKPSNQDAMVGQVYFMGALTSSNCRMHTMFTSLAT